MILQVAPPISLSDRCGEPAFSPLSRYKSSMVSGSQGQHAKCHGKKCHGKKTNDHSLKKAKDVIQTTQKKSVSIPLPNILSKLVNSEDLDFEVDVRG